AQLRGLAMKKSLCPGIVRVGCHAAFLDFLKCRDLRQIENILDFDRFPAGAPEPRRAERRESRGCRRTCQPPWVAPAPPARSRSPRFSIIAAVSAKTGWK